MTGSMQKKHCDTCMITECMLCGVLERDAHRVLPLCERLPRLHLLILRRGTVFSDTIQYFCKV